jgi:hypothetical protein
VGRERALQLSLYFNGFRHEEAQAETESARTPFTARFDNDFNGF